MSETRPRSRRWTFADSTSALLLLVLASAHLRGQEPNALLDRAVDEFERGRIESSVAAFDELVKVAPRAMPQLWQRGIALYYAGRFDDCRKQFESHRTVNPNDVENAAWHFLCVARAESPQKARAALLPVGPDARVPMREVYELYRGAVVPEQVMRAAESNPSGQFYANLYVGLYYEATGDPVRARAALETAAQDRFAPVGGYMHMVATVHVARLRSSRP
ncbi:MAG: hypothetical protein FJW27_15390 [Acidimicrobiia bacterium]|nr:hypothetical protein [Acidimicrobiia bacterium]